jgi:hypothetical protein
VGCPWISAVLGRLNTNDKHCDHNSEDGQLPERESEFHGSCFSFFDTSMKDELLKVQTISRRLTLAVSRFHRPLEEWMAEFLLANPAAFTR